MHTDTHTYRHTHTCGLQMGLVCFAVEGTFAGGSLRWPVCTTTSLVLVYFFFFFFKYGCSKASNKLS